MNTKKNDYLIPSFIGAEGDLHEVSTDTYRYMEKLIGNSNKSKTEQAIIPPVKVVTEGQPISIEVKPQAQQSTWQLYLENGDIQGKGQVENHLITLPDNLPLGYHQLTLTVGDKHLACRVIVTPKQAFLPKPLKNKEKLWGALLQLYTLRSESNWGIGDFGDLNDFLQHFSNNGGDFVGLNPIHSLFPTAPEDASPYSPSSRLWLNIIYIDLNKVATFKQSEQAQEWFNSPAIQAQLDTERNKDYIDYTAVMTLKVQGLKLAYQHFKAGYRSDSDEVLHFEEFIKAQGNPLQIQATFEALHEHWAEQGKAEKDWRKWHSDYHDYQSPAAVEFQKAYADKVRFYCWLQYLAHQQLCECNEKAKTLGMPIGIYRDLAVGVTAYGAETWADKDLYVLDASVGAPPDIMAPQGQNWNLSPMHPEVLQQRAYQPFIDLLRANMKDCGALRIDHILALARLWWIPTGQSAKDGMYIRYPLNDLLSILALESQRNQCLVIAEALGVVPDGLLETLEEKNILTYNIFYFEMNEKGCKPLEKYPYLAMTAISTHDLPTIKGYKQNYDFELGKKLNIYPNEKVLNNLKTNRVKDKKAINKALQLSGVNSYTDKPFSHQVQIHSAKTNSALFATQPEDWLNMLEPVNIPGTSDNFPNWRRKLSKTIEEIFTDKDNISLWQECINRRKNN